MEALIHDRHLIIVPTGALTQLPFQVLITEKPSRGASEADRHRQAAWLARRAPITVLPAIGSLDALRKYAKASAAPQPYLGFGNPLLAGPDTRYAPLAALARARQSCADPSGPKSVALPQLRGPAGRMVTSNGLADLAFLRAQPPLPETADELCAVARDLHAGANAVQLGRHAAEAEVKRFSKDGALARYRVLHFATHGAMVGEVVGSSEPGLVLTPPEKATGVDDGYLSASEIALLKLDADLVILSACNTAAGGAEGSETLSGLARSFFYAGARALVRFALGGQFGGDRQADHQSARGDGGRREDRSRRSAARLDFGAHCAGSDAEVPSGQLGAVRRRRRRGEVSQKRASSTADDSIESETRSRFHFS